MGSFGTVANRRWTAYLQSGRLVTNPPQVANPPHIRIVTPPPAATTSRKDKAHHSDAPRTLLQTFRQSKLSAVRPRLPVGRTCGPACFARGPRATRARG